MTESKNQDKLPEWERMYFMCVGGRERKIFDMYITDELEDVVSL